MSLSPAVFWGAGAAVCLCMVALVFWRLFERARPDEWMLIIRNGKLVRAGVGVYLLRRPADAVARFTATMQRVRFQAEALTSERLAVRVDGFLLWAVSSTDGEPFRAFSKLGIVNLADRHSAQGLCRKHLLTGPQHKAFQQLLVAAVQRHAAAFTIEELLGEQDRFVDGLRQRLLVSTGEMGVAIEDLQILQIRPVAAEVLERMSVESSEQIREQAQRVQLETEQRIERRQIEAQTATANERTNASRETEVHEARTALQVEAEKAELLARSLELEGSRLEHQAELDRLRSDNEHAAKMYSLKLAAQRDLAREDNAAALSSKKRERRGAELTAELDAKRAKAEAERDAVALVSTAEEAKSAAVRDYELARLATQKVADAFASLPLQEARWVSVGSDSPVSALAALVAEATGAFGGASREG